MSDDGKARLKALNEELADLSTRFEEHLLDATNAWALFVDDEAELAGVPADVMAEARAAAHAEGKPGWKLTLRMPCYLPVMQYAHDRELRRRLHEAYATRASDLGAEPRVGQRPGGRAHPALCAAKRRLARLSQLRRGVAGAEDGAIARRSRRVSARPGRRARPFAQRDYDDLVAFARDTSG